MRRRLLASYLTITLVTLLLLVVPLGQTFASRESDRLLRDIGQDAIVVASLSEVALERGTPPDLASTLTAYAADPGGRIVVVDRSGYSVADSDTATPPGTSFRNRPEIMSAIQGRRAEGRRPSATLNADLLYVAVPVASSGVVHGAVRITYPSSKLDDRIRSAWLGLGVLAAIVAAVVAMVGIALAGLVTRPVDRLKAAARQIAEGDLSARAPTDAGAPELRELALVFNETAARQQELLEAQRDFVGDASHQLRTPLAAIRLQLENIEAVVPIEVQPAVAAVESDHNRIRTTRCPRGRVRTQHPRANSGHAKRRYFESCPGLPGEAIQPCGRSAHPSENPSGRCCDRPLSFRRLPTLQQGVSMKIKKINKSDVLVSDAEAATLLGVSVWTVRRERKAGRLPHVVVRGAIRIPMSGLDAYVVARTLGGAA